MRVLIAHNAYKIRGGEDVVFEGETDLLTGGGHAGSTVKVSNAELGSMRELGCDCVFAGGGPERAAHAAAARLFWSKERRDARRLVD